MAKELKRSGLTAVCASFVLDFTPDDKPGAARDKFLRWLTAIDAQLEKEHIHRALNLKDLQAAHAQATHDRSDSGRITVHRGAPGSGGGGVQTWPAGPSTAS